MKQFNYLLPLLFMGGILATGCKKPEEPIAKGIYYLNNKSPYTLHIEARKNGNPVGLTRDSVLDSTMSHFCTVFEGTGGHVRPSNFFTEFKVTAHLPGGDSVFYEGVNDGDWEQHSLSESDHEFALTLH